MAFLSSVVSPAFPSSAVLYPQGRGKAGQAQLQAEARLCPEASAHHQTALPQAGAEQLLKWEVLCPSSSSCFQCPGLPSTVVAATEQGC